MGLDSYAVLPEPEDEEGYTIYPAAPDDAFAGIHLCGGMFSGGQGSSSFRGKVYADAIERATGVSLYQEYIPPDVVAKMADDMTERPPDDDAADDLVKFFQVCKASGYGLSGWW